MMMKRFTVLVLACMLSISLLVGCTPADNEKSGSDNDETVTGSTAPKYIFMLIGDGMSAVQVNAAQVLTGDNISGEVALNNLNFTEFPAVGMATTQDSTSFCPDSASTATAMSCGVKTHSGVIGLEADKQTVADNICELLKAEGMKIGVISSVTINHATPAAYYAHIASRNDYYDIAMQMADSGFDYFGGGTINKSTGAEEDQQDAYEILEEEGFTVADTNEEIAALNSDSGPCYAVTPITQDSGAMNYAIDAASDELSLADFLQKGIEVLDNENGFFIMCESGKIDWACHANDAMATIGDILAFEDVVDVALQFAQAHPQETLIIVTGDHETGGMTIGYASTGYSTAFDVLNNQKMSFTAFDTLMATQKEANPDLTFDAVMPLISANFGLILSSDPAATEDNVMVLSELEEQKLRDAFAESMKPEEERTESDETYLLYGGYDPLSVTITHILNNKAGIGWTSYSHTGVPVPVYAYGVGADLFNGYYDNTDVFNKLCEICQI
jgi:alkaline phosphatase